MVDVADEWEAVEAQVAAMLRGRGLSPDDATDLSREALTRAMEKGIAFASPEGLLHWVSRVAWRLSTDRWRATQRRSQVELDPDAFATDADQVFNVVRHRLALDEVKHLMPSMSEPQRSALARLAGEADQAEPSRAERLRRVRARQKLRRGVQNFPGVVLVRKWLAARSRPRLAWFATGAAVPSTMACLLLLNGGLGPIAPWGGLARTGSKPNMVTVEAVTGSAIEPAPTPTAVVARRGVRPKKADGGVRPRDFDLDPSDQRVYVPRPMPDGPGGVIVETQPNGPERPIACVALAPLPETCVERL